jgi:hypothetical protein
MDQPPINLARHRIDIALPQKPYIVRLLQRVYGCWVGIRLPVVQPDRAHILVPPVDCLHLALSPQPFRYLRRSHAQHQQNQKNRDNQPHQHEALLALPLYLCAAFYL